jgi:putative endonuclease
LSAARSVAGVSSDARHRLGALGEQLAAEHLVRRGFTILERNYRTRWGELDIVAYDGQTLAFCEVKTRMHGGGFALEAVGGRKRARVRKMAGSWMSDRSERPYAARIRCDAIGVTFDGAGQLLAIEHLEGAF